MLNRDGRYYLVMVMGDCLVLSHVNLFKKIFRSSRFPHCLLCRCTSSIDSIHRLCVTEGLQNMETEKSKIYFHTDSIYVCPIILINTSIIIFF